jgi:4-diphosphocytidyl-2-C-methyl-D-erythritol kinase
MPGEVSLRSPAKINWSLEVLAHRDDGYHEIRTIFQTIALSDNITFEQADDIEVALSGAHVLADQPPETNLAYRAASALREARGVDAGVRIHIEKRIPVGAGLGGGSSNAATTLRALKTLWRLPLTTSELADAGSRLGSDVPFFLYGGTALGAGRGDEITPLPDTTPQRLLLVWPNIDIEDKTAQMYQALKASQYSDGATTEQLTQRLGQSNVDTALRNPFEHVLGDVDAQAAQAFADAHAFGQPHLTGSGPAFFYLLPPDAPVAQMVNGLKKLRLSVIETQTISASEALASN